MDRFEDMLKNVKEREQIRSQLSDIEHLIVHQLVELGAHEFFTVNWRKLNTIVKRELGD